MDPFREHGVGRCLDKDQEKNHVQKVLTVALIGAAMATAACNTVRGAARDVNSVANCTENTMGGGTRC